MLDSVPVCLIVGIKMMAKYINNEGDVRPHGLREIAELTHNRPIQQQ